MDFIINYWEGNKNHIIEAIDELIDNLQSDEKSWTIYSLLNYLNTIYKIVKKNIKSDVINSNSDKQIESLKKKSDYIIEESYSIFNTGLINKRGEYIYFLST